MTTAAKVRVSSAVQEIYEQSDAALGLQGWELVNYTVTPYREQRPIRERHLETAHKALAVCPLESRKALRRSPMPGGVCCVRPRRLGMRHLFESVE